jgi:tetratricopeptide (TPR) repeat protein
VGQLDKAILAYQRYIVRFSDKKDVPDIAFNIALVFEKEKKWAEALKAYESFATTYARDSRITPIKMYEAKHRIFLANRQLKNAAEVERLQKDLIAAYGKLSADDKKSDRAMMAFAHARFLNLEPMWKQYLDIRFNKVATIKKDLAVKLKKIQEVEKAYTEVLAIGSGEYGIAALTRIGLAYADFAQNFLDSPDPKGLDEEQLEMYRSELENRAFPLEEKAIEALEKALSKSYELNVYNEWTLLAQEQINRYRPGTYGNVKEVPYRGADFVATSWVLKDAGAGETGGALVPSTTASTQAPASAGSR